MLYCFHVLNGVTPELIDSGVPAFVGGWLFQFATVLFFFELPDFGVPAFVGVAHLNIRSIRSKIDEIILLLSNFKFDIFTVSESWLHSQLESTIFSVERYNLLRQDRGCNEYDSDAVKKGGGLLAYLAEDLTFNAEKFKLLNRSDSNLEMQIFTARKGDDKEAIIVNLYRPPSGSFEAFMNHIQQVMDTVNGERYLDIYIIGDVNLDHLPPINSEKMRSFERLLSSYGLEQQINSPTCRKLGRAALLDVIYVKTKKNIRASVLDTAMSDHSIVVSVRYLKYDKPARKWIEARTYRNYSYESASEYYSKINKDRVLMYRDTEKIWSLLKSYILNCANVLAPYRKIQIRSDDVPWVTKEKELLADRDNMFLEAYANTRPDLLQRARELRTSAKKAVRNARASYVNDVLGRCAWDPKRFWQNINLLINRKSMCPQIELKRDSGIQVQPNELPDYINEFFTTIGPKLASSFDPTDEVDDVVYNTHQLMEFNQISDDTFERQVKAINIYKGSGIQGVSTRIIKDAMKIMKQEFLYLFNLTLITGKIPRKVHTNRGPTRLCPRTPVIHNLC